MDTDLDADGARGDSSIEHTGLVLGEGLCKDAPRSACLFSIPSTIRHLASVNLAKQLHCKSRISAGMWLSGLSSSAGGIKEPTPAG